MEMTLEEALEFAHSKRDRLVKNEVLFALALKTKLTTRIFSTSSTAFIGIR